MYKLCSGKGAYPGDLLGCGEDWSAGGLRLLTGAGSYRMDGQL
jgi:hypothetical protein